MVSVTLMNGSKHLVYKAKTLQTLVEQKSWVQRQEYKSGHTVGAQDL